MLDSGDVEKVILVVVGQVALHLRRIHAAIGLRDIDRRNAERREDIAGHFFLCLPCAKKDRHNDDEEGVWVA